MKEVRIQFTPEEYENIKTDAEQLGVSLKSLIHNRTISNTSASTFYLAKTLSDEVSLCRREFNRIIQREMRSGSGLFEDDIIRLELTLSEVEKIVTTFVSTKLKEVM